MVLTEDPDLILTDAIAPRIAEHALLPIAAVVLSKLLDLGGHDVPPCERRTPPSRDDWRAL